MPSPAKKRKLNGDSQSSLPSRGLEYFFAKQKGQNASASSSRNENTPSEHVAYSVQDHEMTDEELARKLQAEWDQEASVPTTAREARAPNNDIAGMSELSRRDTQLEENHIKVDTMPSEPPKRDIAELPSKEKGKSTLSLQSVAASVDTVSESIPFDESPLTFDPDRYIPQLRAHWAKGVGNASYALLTRCFVLVSGTSSRIKIVDTLVNCLRILIAEDPDSLLPAVSHEFHEDHSEQLGILFLSLSLLMCLFGALSSPCQHKFTDQELGLAVYQRYLTSLHIPGARIRRLCDLEGLTASMWSRQPLPQGNL